MGFLPPIRTDIQAEPADRNQSLLLHLLKVPLAGSGIEPCLPGLVRGERPSRKRLNRADINARRAFPATLFHRITGRGKRCVREDCDPPDPGAMVRGDKETTFSYPAHSRQVGSEFLGEDAADTCITRPFRCRNGKC